jgi:hypothetical protein
MLVTNSQYKHIGDGSEFALVLQDHPHDAFTLQCVMPGGKQYS